jgi:hypothetical protein
MVTVFVLIRVTILRTNRSHLKGPAEITALPACPCDLRSVTSNYSRAVTIFLTLLLRLSKVCSLFRILTDHLQASLHRSQSVTPPTLKYRLSESCLLGP